jgi:hypothetical protein
MIKTPSFVGLLTTALHLTDNSEVILSVGKDNKARVMYQGQIHIFDSEYELIIWLYAKIEASAKNSRDWFEKHREAFTKESTNVPNS